LVHGQVHNLFRVDQHLLSASNYRCLRSKSFETWQQVSCACWMGKCQLVRSILILLANLTEPTKAQKWDAVPTSSAVWPKRKSHFRSFQLTIFITDSDVFTLPTI
jgi:hypothetical protein